MSASYNYEIMMVFSVANGEEGANALLEKFKGMIEANGTVDNVDVWGKRKLEYLTLGTPDIFR